MSTNDLITDWLNNQHEWIQEAAHRLLAQGRLNEADFADFVDIIKNPKLVASTPRTFVVISTDATTAADLRLHSIGPVIGIDALNTKKPLEFGDGNLSVVYGSNGSGKSGYARIITKACGKPHSVELKPNVYYGAPSKQECKFDYSIGGQKKTAVWIANTDPVEDLKPIDVFDTESGRIYLEKDTDLSYEPPELTLFADLVNACKKVEAALSVEQQKLVSKLPRIPTQYANSPAGKAYAAISKDITPAKLAELVTWTAADENALREQGQRLRVTDPTAAAKKKREAKAQIDAIRAALQKAVSALGKVALDAIKCLETAAAEKRKVVQEGAEAMGEAARLDGIGSATWKAMWEAARTYSAIEAYPDFAFPHTEEGARCVLCHQHLDEKAKRRLEGFEKFVKGTLEAEATVAEKTLKESLRSLPTRPTSEVLAASCQAASLSEEMLDAVEFAWATLEPLLSPLREGTFPEQPPIIDENVSRLIAKLEELSIAAENAAQELDTDAKSGDRAQARAKLAELEGKKWVTEQAFAVRAEVDRLKTLAQYEDWKRKTATTGISRKAGEISEALITEAYIQRFNEELKKLGAHKIQVELIQTATRHGKSKHGIQLQDVTFDRVRVSEVLSEGEKRIVALAAFLADVTGRNTNSPFVFDDPISSLDQNFEEKVITRLIELSKDRQVLVFTHRLSFLGIMNHLAAGALHDVHIRREPWGTGQPGEVPLFGKKPDKALNNLKGERVPKARKAHEKEGYEAYYPLAKAICSDFRILMERIVERVFLADVVQRHRRDVTTKDKIGHLAKITSEDCKLVGEMMTKYSCYEHSQSDESPIDVPEPDELQEDIESVLTWHSEFTKRSQL